MGREGRREPDGTLYRHHRTAYDGVWFFYTEAGAGDPGEHPEKIKWISDDLDELYPIALDAGIPPDTFWDSSLSEIRELLESYSREEKRKRKEKILDDFIMAEAIAVNLATMFSPDTKADTVKPWDYYQKLFAEEKEIYDKNKAGRDLEEYKEKRRAYAAEVNRRRQQGLM